MSQFALHPRSSILLCCTTLTDFVFFILKCKMPFRSMNILDLFVRGRPCVSCFPYFVSVPKWNLHVLGPIVFVFADRKQYILHWWHMQSSASCRTSSSWFLVLNLLEPLAVGKMYMRQPRAIMECPLLNCPDWMFDPDSSHVERNKKALLPGINSDDVFPIVPGSIVRVWLCKPWDFWAHLHGQSLV